MDERSDKAGTFDRDDILAGYIEAVQQLRDRVEELEARIKLPCPSCKDREDKFDMLERNIKARQNKLEDQFNFLQQQLTTMQGAMKEIMERNMCEHEEFRLQADMPFYIMAIADAREAQIVAPGRQPEPTFALAICRKCWQVFPAVNKVAEAPPHEGGYPPPKMVKPGEVVE
jgi:hypothetical protein